MATLRDIKARIKLVANIKKITKAMQLVAAAKFNRAQNRAKASRPYNEELSRLLASLAFAARSAWEREGGEKMIRIGFGAKDIELSFARLFDDRPPAKQGIVLMTGDRGLCGAFNTRLIRKAQSMIDFSEDPRLIIIGKKGYQHFRRRRTPILYHRFGISDKLVLEETREITSILFELFASGEVDCLDLVYTRFKSATMSTVVSERFLRLPLPEESTAGGYILEPDRDTLLSRLLPLYGTTKVLSALAESFASEYGARMSAMQLATKNAEEMLNSLIITRNRLRQAAITKELAEIVGGAEALK